MQLALITATDPDNVGDVPTDAAYDNVTLSVGGADAASFSINASDYLTFTGPANYETDKKSYEINVVD